MAVMGSAPRETPAVDRVHAIAVRAFGAGQRVLAGPDGMLLLAIGLALAALLQIALFGDAEQRGSAILMNLIGTLPLALAPRRLLPAAALVTLATCVEISDPEASVTVAALVAQLSLAYLVASRRHRLASIALSLPLLVVAVSAPTGNKGLLVLVLVVAAQVFGDARRQRGQAIAERDATRQAMADTLREQAAMDERARIARELHDVVAHHVSMVAVQAETARLTTAGMPQEGRDRLAAIGDTARDALTEMRRLLGVLRSDQAEPERAPQPGLARLDELLDDARAAGTTVRLMVRGPVVALAPGVDLTAYRIVQEALTNAGKHARGSTAWVRITGGPDGGLHVSIRNRKSLRATADPALPGAGAGLLGLQERVALAGGTLVHGPDESGDFVVDAELQWHK
jgi:signal transduction histidine kinase